MPRSPRLGLPIDYSESSGSSSCSWGHTDDESLENPFWVDILGDRRHVPPTDVWDDEESATLSPLQTTGASLEGKSLPMFPSDYSSCESSSIDRPCEFRSRIRRRMEQLEQESLSSTCSEDEDDFVSRENPPRPKWRIYLALVAITMMVLSHTRPPRLFVEIRREEVALGHLRNHIKSHKLPKYFMPKFDSSAQASLAAAASPATTDNQAAGTNRANFALAQTSKASRPVFERFEFREEEEPLAPPLAQPYSWTTYFAGITFFCLLVETTYKECRVGRREERRL